MATSSKKQIGMDKVSEEVSAEEVVKASEPEINLAKNSPAPAAVEESRSAKTVKVPKVEAEVKVEEVVNTYEGSAIRSKAQRCIEKAGVGAQKYLPLRTR